jgi:hypothetical protein
MYYSFRALSAIFHLSRTSMAAAMTTDYVIQCRHLSFCQPCVGIYRSFSHALVWLCIGNSPEGLKYKGELRYVTGLYQFFPSRIGHPMARFAPAALFFFLATLISHAFTLPLLRRDYISQLKADILLATDDVTTLSQDISRASWAYTLTAVSNLHSLK